ncbi:MAG: radical SAM protein [archaeon]
MKVSFINFSAFAFGTRAISSYLKSKGHKTQMLFFPNVSDRQINEKLLENIYEIVKDSDVIGISIMCSDYFESIKITKYLKKRLNVPIIWGGPQPIADPEECIKHCDGVCIGEGEEAFLELVGKIKGKKDYSKVSNFWFKNSKNHPMELVTDLDKYPFPDYDFENHFIYDEKKRVFKKIDKNDLIKHVFLNNFVQYGNYKMYHFVSTRGCPHNCTYCGNSILRRKYKGTYVRKRSNVNVIAELKWIKQKFPFINYIAFEDDTFTIRSDEEIIEFSRMYKREIDLPFHLSSTALTLNETKLKTLLDCGLTSVRIGIQSGSERILKEVYKRNIPNTATIRCAKLLHKYRKRFKHLNIYDFIFDNPFETTEDYIETIKLISKLPKPYVALYHSLSFYPGTELLDMARDAGYIHDEKGQVYNKSTRAGEFNYIRFFATSYPIIPIRFPKWFLRYLTREKRVKNWNRKKFNQLFRPLTIFVLFSSYSIQKLKGVIRNGITIDEIKTISQRVKEHFFTKSVARKL